MGGARESMGVVAEVTVIADAHLLHVDTDPFLPAAAIHRFGSRRVLVGVIGHGATEEGEVGQAVIDIIPVPADATCFLLALDCTLVLFAVFLQRLHVGWSCAGDSKNKRRDTGRATVLTGGAVLVSRPREVVALSVVDSYGALGTPHGGAEEQEGGGRQGSAASRSYRTGHFLFSSSSSRLLSPSFLSSYLTSFSLPPFLSLSLCTLPPKYNPLFFQYFSTSTLFLH